MAHNQNERPIRSIWYGHAGKPPEALPPSTYDSPIHDVGFHQSIEWIETITDYSTPLISSDRSGRSMDTRLYELQKNRTGQLRTRPMVGSRRSLAGNNSMASNKGCQSLVAGCNVLTARKLPCMLHTISSHCKKGYQHSLAAKVYPCKPYSLVLFIKSF